jgi:hypothetical protein
MGVVQILKRASPQSLIESPPYLSMVPNKLLNSALFVVRDDEKKEKNQLTSYGIEAPHD